MNYSKMTKSELIALLKEKETQRAFSYEDQMKLLILDQSPFTIWASDRDCIIKFWEGQCEHHYGYTREEAIGKDFVDLFVDEHEAQTAREDQINIIDNGAVYHNIANDHGKEGNNLYLITNCRRIRDIKTGEIWNAEMGLTIDYLTDEMNRLEQIVAESKRVEKYVLQLSESFKKELDKYNSRKDNFRLSIQRCERLAINCNRRDEVRDELKEIKNKINEFGTELEEKVKSFCTKIQDCKRYEDCEQIRSAFSKECVEYSDAFESVVLDVEEIAHKLSNTKDIYSHELDITLRDSQKLSRSLYERAQKLLSQAEKEVADYRNLQPDPNSEILKGLVDNEKEVENIKEQINGVENNIHAELRRANTEKAIKQVRDNMEKQYNELDNKLKVLEKRLNNDN